MSALHRCPIEGCETRIAWDLAMCRDHWRLVSRDLQRRLYTAWRRGRGYGTRLHLDALQACVDDVEETLAAKRSNQPARLF